ncbi:MAG: hypothetical protein IIY81_08550, partial [Lachnospiraceae bacterium]|nr:hypothetical protein [Lachnospiraceae bacterium]
LKNTSPSVQCVFMFGVSQIEMIVEIALSLLAVMCNFHNHFCPAELLRILVKKCKKILAICTKTL